MTLWILKSLVWGDMNLETLPASCTCSQCTALRAMKKKEARSTVFQKGFMYRCLVVGFLWYVWFLNYTTVMSLENIASFDPFAILGVGNDATIKDIKKAYRRLSLTMHPDKNPDNPLAVQEFIKLTKAYSVSIHSQNLTYMCRFSLMR